MAWRIEESVQRGEVDNRERGLIRGRIWLHGHSDPVELRLRGNACADLAGCRLTFVNSRPTIPLPRGADFSSPQEGAAGDLTASRKVRPPRRRTEEAYRGKEGQRPEPRCVANALYLEWFSAANGRVVIESTDFKLVVSPPAWRLSPEEEQRRCEQSSAAFTGFIDELSDAIKAEKHTPPPDREWDEFDYEKLMRESDASTDKYMELLDKHRDNPDRERIIAEEMGWDWADPELDMEMDEEFLNDSDDWLDEMDFSAEFPEMEPDPATEGVDWVRDDDGQIGHPLYFRAFRSSTAFWRACDKLGLGETEDPDLCDLIGEYQITAVKLAGALNSLAYRGEMIAGPFIVAYLKRALNHLHATQSSLEQVVSRKLLPPKLTNAARAELFGIREEILRLMEEFRSR